MKQKIMLLAVIIISVLLAACSHFTMNNATVSGRDIVGTRTLTISIAENDYYKSTVAPAKASASARTIVPDAFEDTGLKFYMYGEATNGEKLYPVEITGKVLTDSKKIKMDMEAYNWDLTLACTDSAAAALTLACTSDVSTHTAANFNADIRNIEEKAVLIAHTSVDMQYSTNVNFVLSPRGLVNPSSLNFDLYSTGWQKSSASDTTAGTEIYIKDPDTSDTDVPFTIKVGIYDFITGAPLDDAASTPATTVHNLDVDDFGNAPVTDFATGTDDGNYKITAMTPGTYTFKVTFTQASTGLNYVWSDVIIVLPGVNHRVSIGIPNVIGKLPDVPTSFKAGYVAGSEDVEIGYYDAVLVWTDDSNNETHFEIDFVELNEAHTDDIVTPTSDATWTTALTYEPDGGSETTEEVMIYGIDTVATSHGEGIYENYTPFAGSALQKGGSLMANNETVTIRLELGRRYLARIYSVNEAGRSATAAYLTLSNLALADLKVAGLKTDDATEAAPYTAFPSTATTMNRYRTTYHLQDGEWFPRGTTTGAGTDSYADEPYLLDQIYYETQSDTAGNAIIAPYGAEAVADPATPAVPLLKRGAYGWFCWNTMSGATATEYPGTQPAADASIEDYYVTPNPYKGFENLDLYAAYNNVAGYEIYDDSAYNITYSMLAKQVVGTDENYVPFEENQTNLEVNVISDPSVKFKLTPPDTGVFASPFKYDWVSFEIKKGNRTYFAGVAKNVDNNHPAEFTCLMNEYVAGHYSAKFVAKYGTTIVSYPIVIDVISE